LAAFISLSSRHKSQLTVSGLLLDNSFTASSFPIKIFFGKPSIPISGMKNSFLQMGQLSLSCEGLLAAQLPIHFKQKE
jgi:hypothetical protein